MTSFRLSVLTILLGLCFSCSQKKAENIVIIDVADFGRSSIAEEIEIIRSLNPRVLAIDLQFSERYELENDLALKRSLDECDELIMASVIQGEYQGDDVKYEGLIGSDTFFLSNAKTGFINVILEQDEFNTLKRFSVVENVNNKLEYHFAVRAALSFDSLATSTFIRTHPKIVDVNFLGSIEAFVWYSARDVLDGKVKPEDINDKIVIVGALSIFDNDRFHTPLNKSSAKPDMFGVVYLANVINQILSHEPN